MKRKDLRTLGEIKGGYYTFQLNVMAMSKVHEVVPDFAADGLGHSFSSDECHVDTKKKTREIIITTLSWVYNKKKTS